jgi:molybdopterin-guanine dinucleotide biosynthesis protein A
VSAPGDRIGAVVLAGGRSSRFGRDKLEVEVGDRRLLDRAVDAVRPVADEIVVVGPVHVERAAGPGIRVVRDKVAYEGPLVGLATGLEGLGPDVDRVLVIGGDMPSLVPDVLRLLVAALDGDAVAAWLEREPSPRPLPMAIRRRAGISTAARLVAAGERRLRALPEALGAVMVTADAWRRLDHDGASLRDVDVPTDLHDEEAGPH